MEEITPKPAKFYGPLSAIFITIGIYLGAQLLGGLLLSLLPPALLKWTPERTNTWLSHSAWAQFLFIATVEAITLFSVYKVVTHRRANFRTLGLDHPQFKYVGSALGGFAVYFVLYIIILTVVSQLIPGLNVDQKQELGFNMTAHGNELWAIFASLVILPPITEEIVVRGFLYSGLRTKLTPIVSAVIASSLFAAAHLGEGGSGGLLWVAAIDTFILSMVLCHLREKTKSLWPSIGVHMIKNGLAFVLLFKIFQHI